MTITPHFLCALLDSSECQLFLDESGEVVAYVPRRANPIATIGLNVTSYVDAELKARRMGLEPKWCI